MNLSHTSALLIYSNFFNTCTFSLLQEHFYDPLSHCGFLEMRLRNIRRKLDTSQCRYKRKRASLSLPGGETSEEGQQDCSEWITLMRHLRPTAENIPSIKSAMEQTYDNRRLWISKDSPSMGDIFEKYPRFLDMPNLVRLSLRFFFFCFYKLFIDEVVPLRVSCLTRFQTIAKHFII